MFDQDPNEQANISGADFAIMCDEIKKLKAQRDYLLVALDEIASRSYDAGAVIDAKAAIAKVKDAA